jgi:hypothetical protein
VSVPAKKKSPLPRDATKAATVSFRLETAERERLAAVAALMGARAGGPPLPESYAARAALVRGLDALEAELGAAKRR